MDLWDIVDEFEETSLSNANPKVLKKYQRCVKKTMFIINIDLADNQLVQIKSCKGPAEAWKILCNIYETNSLSNILFIRYKFFTYKMDKGDDLLVHVNKVETLTYQLACLEVPVRDEDISITLLESLPTSYGYLIIAFETMEMKNFLMDYVTICLMHEISKCKKTQPQGDDAAMMLQQNKSDNSFCAKV